MIKILSALLMLLMLTGEGDVRYRIISISSETIKIGQEQKKKGDTFLSSETIHWENDSQVMRVVDMETEEPFVLSSEVQEFMDRHNRGTYHGIVNTLLTHLGQQFTGADANGYYYFTYTKDDGSIAEVKVEKDMFMDEYPSSLALYYFNPVKSSGELRTGDFRGFVDDLIITDHMVKRHMSGLDYYNGEESAMKNDYLLMMRSYIDERYQSIPCTYEDIKMFITLKY